MPTLLAQIAPQRSTQYTELATHLAPLELQLSSCGGQITQSELVTLGTQQYLRFSLPTLPTAADLCELGLLATVSAFFEWFDQVGEVTGPLLRPLPTTFQPALPLDLVMTRRYRGKTNELFTHFLCNLARFSSRFADQPWGNLRLLDPLAGGGTTLFTGLLLGAQVAGVEQSEQDVQSTATFLQHYLREAHIACQVKEERFKKLGRRWVCQVGKPPRQCILAQGDTIHAAALLPGFRPQLIVTDLPYGIQHNGPLIDLLTGALPVWSALLPPQGALVFAWDATRFPRAEMVTLVEQIAPLCVRNEPLYQALAHRVDRVIKLRDVIVAVPRNEDPETQRAPISPRKE
jgi:hypothetical protein